MGNAEIIINTGKNKSDLKKLLDAADGNNLLEPCLTCGACVGGCHLGELNLDVTPRKIVRMIQFGLDEQVLKERDFIWQCTLCRRCTESCPAGIKMDKVVRELRTLYFKNTGAPPDLQAAVTESLTHGNNSEITVEDFVDTIEWLEEELQVEVDDENAKIPIDKQDSHYLFLPNPREIKFLPMLLLSVAKVMYKMGADWTVSTKCFDVTNWAYYTGDMDSAVKIAGKIKNEMKRINAEELLLTECGHGFRVLKFESPDWFGSPHPFKVTSILELMASAIKDNKLQPDPQKTPQLVTYHDPCNLARKGGLYEEPRYILTRSVSNFIELQPNRAYNFCCGGGGGVAQNTWFSESKYTSGQLKIDQLVRSKAEILVTSCQTCYSHISDLINRHKLKIKVKTMAEIVGDAI